MKKEKIIRLKVLKQMNVYQNGKLKVQHWEQDLNLEKILNWQKNNKNYHKWNKINIYLVSFVEENSIKLLGKDI